ncbi:BamA/TamA family outer membrane protein [Flagellimonas zhangzhouensis]|uniref:Surface antigen n=1 Tax=Flagellimonas zhangzhouensis TaxID=1073328 RepID=A0A1H2YAW6_9FLAO|nr:BamA/TamA family outer membrane protein [Allomuricauda zhangzhouensis]SDQ97771.1 Surface antigen [Allomuricauda zhangzhouensis]SDX02115.1 Surface antigen [Allomuricauda zhangzhouensis]
MNNHFAKFRLTTICFFGLSILLCQQILGQKETSNEDKKITAKVFPYINYSRTLELQMGVVGSMMYRLSEKDTISPKSMSGVMGIYTTNDSYLVGTFHRWFLKENDWRLTFYLVNGTQRAQIYVSEVEQPGFADYASNITVINLTALKRIKNKWYGGLGFIYNITNTEFEDSEETNENNYLGFLVQSSFDKRNQIYYPTKGSLTNIQWNSFPTALGNDEDLNIISLSYNKYIGFPNNKNILAFRGHAEFGLGALNFERQVVIGGKDIRGYSDGKYRGDSIFALQGEYRLNFNNNMGLVGFLGAATIFGSINEEFNGKLYPGIGAGYRYTVFKEDNFNIGLDGAVGKDDWGIYFRIGESF